MLVKHQADVVLVEAALAKAGKKLEEMPKWWVDSHIRRTAPPGSTMEANVRAVLENLKGKACVVTGKEIITEAVWEVFNNQSIRNIEIDGVLYNTWDLAAGEDGMLCGSLLHKA
jgi:hypothetical protein